jgi:hypothetical protein
MAVTKQMKDAFFQAMADIDEERKKSGWDPPESPDPDDAAPVERFFECIVHIGDWAEKGNPPLMGDGDDITRMLGLCWVGLEWREALNFVLALRDGDATTMAAHMKKLTEERFGAVLQIVEDPEGYAEAIPSEIVRLSKLKGGRGKPDHGVPFRTAPHVDTWSGWSRPRRGADDGGD